MTPVTRWLALLSALFGFVVALRRWLYRSGVLRAVRAGVPVVVIGNLNLGGSGKTPLTIWVARFLAQAGRRPGIVSRGYGGRLAASRSAPVAVSGASDPAEVGDEPVLLARASGAPVFVGVDRVAACAALRARHPECDVLVLDDGLQHYRLARDIEIVVLDERALGNGRLFPAGPLREPRSRLDEVDAVVLNGAARFDRSRPPQFGMRLDGHDFVRLDEGGVVADPGQLGSKRVHGVAGIGHPERFFAHLEALGLEVIRHPFPDHHAFSAADLEFGDRLPVVMTEKDAVKCAFLGASPEPRFWMLPVRAQVDAALGDLLTGRLRGPQAA